MAASSGSRTAVAENSSLCRKASSSTRKTIGADENPDGRISILPADRGRSPSAACRPAEADCRKSVILHLAMRCEPGRFAVRRGQCRDAPNPDRLAVSGWTEGRLLTNIPLRAGAARDHETAAENQKPDVQKR